MRRHLLDLSPPLEDEQRFGQIEAGKRPAQPLDMLDDSPELTN